jgi:hypothetical protein
MLTQHEEPGEEVTDLQEVAEKEVLEQQEVPEWRSGRA